MSQIALPLAPTTAGASRIVIGSANAHIAEERNLPLGAEAAAYLVPRAGRSFAEIEKLVAAIDRLSLERKQPATHSIWRAALEAVHGPEEPRLL